MMPLCPALGFSLSAHTIYLLECSPKRLRGMVGVTVATFISFGKFSGQLLGIRWGVIYTTESQWRGQVAQMTDDMWMECSPRPQDGSQDPSPSLAPDLWCFRPQYSVVTTRYLVYSGLGKIKICSCFWSHKDDYEMPRKLINESNLPGC